MVVRDNSKMSFNFNGHESQFKNVGVFQWLCLLQKKYKVPYIWNYFKSRHEKGEHDRAGACIKTTLSREESKFMTNSSIGDAKYVVEWYSLVMVEGKRRCEELTMKGHVKRYFGRWSMYISDIHINAKCIWH